MLSSLRTFPTDNIKNFAFYWLFLDVVSWFNCASTCEMQYTPICIKFWQVGYRIFHGKFLRFMSGLRNLGQVIDGTFEKGEYDPKDSTQLN